MTTTRERRRSLRVDVVAPALVLDAAADAAWPCEVENLSLGGASLLAPPRARPTSPNDAVRVDIRLPGRRGIRPRGRICRTWRQPGALAMAIAFDALSPDAEDTIETACLAALERERAPRVLVVDASGRQCAAMARALRGSGHRALPVPTPLEAIGCLTRDAANIAAVVVNLELSQTSGAELLRFLTEEYPDIRRVAVATADRGPAARALVEHRLADAAITATDLDGVVASIATAMSRRG